MAIGIPYTSEELENYKKQIIEWLLKTPASTFTEACNSVRIPYSTAYDWRDRDEEFNRAVKAAMRISHEAGGDFAESKLRSKINDGDTACILFYLKTRHKERGYVERQEQTGANGGAIETINKQALTKEELLQMLSEKGLPTNIFDK